MGNTQPPPSCCFLPPTWRCFLDIPTDSEAAFASSSNTFSLKTLAVASVPGSTNFALTKRRQDDL